MLGKEWQTLYRSFLRDPVGTDSDSATSSPLHGLIRRDSDGKKLSIPSNFRTPVPQAPRARKISGIRLYFPRVYTEDQLSNPGYAISSLPTCANSKFPASGEEN